MQNCLFCRIIAGEIPSTVVYEDDWAVAFRDIAPAAPIHILLVPRIHVRNILEAGSHPGLMDGLAKAVAAVARAEGLDKSGFRVSINTGADAGQTVEHLHLHLLGGRVLGLMG